MSFLIIYSQAMIKAVQHCIMYYQVIRSNCLNLCQQSPRLLWDTSWQRYISNFETSIRLAKANLNEGTDIVGCHTTHLINYRIIRNRKAHWEILIIVLMYLLNKWNVYGTRCVCNLYIPRLILLWDFPRY